MSHPFDQAFFSSSLSIFDSNKDKLRDELTKLQIEKIKLDISQQRAAMGLPETIKHSRINYNHPALAVNTACKDVGAALKATGNGLKAAGNGLKDVGVNIWNKFSSKNETATLGNDRAAENKLGGNTTSCFTPEGKQAIVDALKKSSAFTQAHSPKNAQKQSQESSMGVKR